MSTPIRARRLMIYLGESDSWRGHSLYMRILETLRKGGIAGATVTRAIAGYGAHSRIRTQTVEILSTDLPIVIAVIDTPENIERALSLVAPMVREGLITLEDVQIIKYTHRYLNPLPADRLVSEVMTQEVTTITADTPARQVVELLLGKLFRALPVVDEERNVIGIITDGDLLRNAGMPVRLSVGGRLEADDLREFLAQIQEEKTAKDIMTTPVVTAREDEALGHVVQRLLDHRLKRLPVVNADGKLAGIISRLDVLRAAAGQSGGQPEHAIRPLPGQTVAELMSVHLPTVHINDDLVDVLQKMLDTGSERVIVLDEREKPVGVITDGDVVARVNPVIRRNVLETLAARVMKSVLSRSETTARDLMSENVLSAGKSTTVPEAIALMLHEGRKYLVIVDENGSPVGTVDRQILMAASLGYGNQAGKK